MKIALVGPELEENLALRYLHAALGRAGHAAEIYDFHAAEQIPGLVERMTKEGEDYIQARRAFISATRLRVTLTSSVDSLGALAGVSSGTSSTRCITLLLSS